MRPVNRAIILCCFFALNVITPNDVRAEEQDKLDNSERTIAFFSPMDGRYIDYGESSFSAPPGRSLSSTRPSSPVSRVATLTIRLLSKSGLTE